MPKKAPANPRPPVEDESDARFLPVIDALAETDAFSLMENKSRSMRGLMFNGKSFGMVSHGRLILRFNEQRASELLATGVAAQFYPSPGKPMRGWVEITDREADRVALAKEAQAMAADAGKASKRGSKGLGTQHAVPGG